MSSYGGILRINRKRWAHNDEFSHFEAAHLIDTVRIVMAHIGDPARAAEVAQLHSALVEELTADDAGTDVSLEPLPELAVEYVTTCEAEPALRAPGLAGIRPLSHETSWEPWEVTLMGDSEVLDTMRTKAAKERVRAVIEDIVDAEAPIQIERLAKLVGYAYGLNRVQVERVKKITYQVKKSLVVVDSDNFVWPQNVDHERWLLYRSCSENDRKLDQISPVELANAAVDILTRKGSMTADALGPMIMARFGRSRMSKLTKTHLAKGFEQAKAFGRITEVDGEVKLAAGPLDAGLATV